ncbi:MAG: PKD domain-containing protein [Bacteroidota bacterium]
MKLYHPRFPLRLRQARSPKKPWLNKLLLPFMMLLVISITTTFAQENANYIYLAGQITNIENGAPVAGQAVYIESNSEYNGGFNYFLAAYTDAYGFFYDTISTAVIDGSLIIYTFDEFSEEYEKEEFFRFNWYSEYHMNTGLEIIDPNTLTDFQANFEVLKDTVTLDSLSFLFLDESIGEGIVSWFWDFGDGTASTERYPQHRYMNAGIYDVVLTVSNDAITNDIRTSTIVKKVGAGMRQYFDFGGQAFAGYFPVDIGLAYLYKIENDEFIPIDTTEFDQYGYYGYHALIEGDYKVKTFPSTNSVNAGEYLPTYYGDELLWTKAQTINLTANNHNYDIQMIPNYTYTSGDGTIDGIVTLEDKDNAALNNVEVILFNEADNCLTYIKSDKEGGFEFIELPYGTYKVLAEVPGKYTYPTSITLSASNPSIENLSIVVYDDEMSYGIEVPVNTIAGLGELYPNPARSLTRLEFNIAKASQVQFFVLNQDGQVVDKQMDYYISGKHTVQFDLSQFSSGMYRVMVLTGNEKHIKPFIKVN